MPTIYGKFAEFDKTHQEALGAIEQMINSTKDYDKDFVKVAKWLLTNEYNPYAYLQESWANATTNSTGMESLIHHLHHAMVDDGDVSFARADIGYTVEYKIVFRCRWDLQEKPELFFSEFRHNPPKINELFIYEHSDVGQWIKDYCFMEEEWKRKCEKWEKKEDDENI